MYKIDKQQGFTIQHRDCIQYFVIIYMGKESKNIYTHIYTHIYVSVTESLHCTPKKLIK